MIIPIKNSKSTENSKNHLGYYKVHLSLKYLVLNVVVQTKLFNIVQVTNIIEIWQIDVYFLHIFLELYWSMNLYLFVHC